MDKDLIIEDILLECLRHFVEEEKYFERISSANDPNCPEEKERPFSRELEKNYIALKELLPQIDAKIESENRRIEQLKSLPLNRGSSENYGTLYKKLDELHGERDSIKISQGDSRIYSGGELAFEFHKVKILCNYSHG